jgi:hypothetical protein
MLDGVADEVVQQDFGQQGIDEQRYRLTRFGAYLQGFQFHEFGEPYARNGASLRDFTLSTFFIYIFSACNGRYGAILEEICT